jgi:hypothetical protein
MTDALLPGGRACEAIKLFDPTAAGQFRMKYSSRPRLPAMIEFCRVRDAASPMVGL